MAIGKRRSDRLMLTIRLRVHGEESNGAEFKADGRTVILNRHGGRIQVGRPLLAGSLVRIINLTTNREAEFRVVGPTAPPKEGSSEWGVEYIHANDDIWGIRFPATEGDSPDAAALLECRKCHGAVLARLSLVEVEVLEAAGVLTRPCETCELKTSWGYAEKQVAMESAKLADAAANAGAGGTNKRRHRRVALQMPARIRDYQGVVEIVKSEDVSKGGFCFVSDKNYLVGAGVMVACPYSPTGQSPEVHARIVRKRVIAGTNRSIFGVSYDQTTG